MSEPTDAQAKIAAYLALHPDPAYWPMRIIDRLIQIEEEEGKEALWTEIWNITMSPRKRCERCGR